MPNWMECEVQIIGPADEIARFRTAHIGNYQDGELQLDFDSIIPIPPELRDTNATPSDAFVWALGGELYASRDLSRRLGFEMADATPLDLTWVRELGITSREGLLNWAEVNRPHELAVANRAMEVERATGYRNWYDWQCDNWGCARVCMAVGRSDGFSHVNPLVGAYPNFQEAG